MIRIFAVTLSGSGFGYNIETLKPALLVAEQQVTPATARFACYDPELILLVVVAV